MEKEHMQMIKRTMLWIFWGIYGLAATFGILFLIFHTEKYAPTLFFVFCIMTAVWGLILGEIQKYQELSAKTWVLGILLTAFLIWLFLEYV